MSDARLTIKCIAAANVPILRNTFMWRRLCSSMKSVGSVFCQKKSKQQHQMSFTLFKRHGRSLHALQTYPASVCQPFRVEGKTVMLHCATSCIEVFAFIFSYDFRFVNPTTHKLCHEKRVKNYFKIPGSLVKPKYTNRIMPQKRTLLMSHCPSLRLEQKSAK